VNAPSAFACSLPASALFSVLLQSEVNQRVRNPLGCLSRLVSEGNPTTTTLLCSLLLFGEQQEQTDPQESPYFDSLCRSFLLGVGAGALVETVHMLGKLVQTPDVQGEQQLPS
jgi:hypothetical protein